MEKCDTPSGLRRWLLTPSRLGLCLYLCFLIAAAVAGSAASETDCRPESASESIDPIADSSDIERGIDYLLRRAPRHPLRRDPADAARLAHEISRTAARHGLPGHLLLAVAYRESSLRTGQIGDLGERGIVQVHPATARRLDCDLSTRPGQLDCGARVLAHGRDHCGDLRGALAYYAGSDGSCDPEQGSRRAWVVRDRLRLARILRGVRNGFRTPSGGKTRKNQ